ncbi:MAG: hydrocarbon degradation protein, partial [Bacteroidales bacterium]|nr:hydrocarbon degradation protein [Bacteroidales bacterium]
MRKHLIFILGLIFANLATGQNADDAWDFSRTIFQGTAKATAMGNAMGAVGGDFTAT